MQDTARRAQRAAQDLRGVALGLQRRTLHGAWIDATQSAEAIAAEVEACSRPHPRRTRADCRPKSGPSTTTRGLARFSWGSGTLPIVSRLLRLSPSRRRLRGLRRREGLDEADIEAAFTEAYQGEYDDLATTHNDSLRNRHHAPLPGHDYSSSAARRSGERVALHMHRLGASRPRAGYGRRHQDGRRFTGHIRLQRLLKSRTSPADPMAGLPCAHWSVPGVRRTVGADWRLAGSTDSSPPDGHADLGRSHLTLGRSVHERSNSALHLLRPTVATSPPTAPSHHPERADPKAGRVRRGSAGAIKKCRPEGATRTRPPRPNDLPRRHPRITETARPVVRRE